jgi:hypothetical protein
VLDWQSRGRRFEPDLLHRKLEGDVKNVTLFILSGEKLTLSGMKCRRSEPDLLHRKLEGDVKNVTLFILSGERRCTELEEVFIPIEARASGSPIFSTETE